MYVNRAVFILIITLLLNGLQAQIPNNSWRDHLAYNQAHSVVITPERVFCAMTTGGMLSYTKSSGEIEKMSKVTGLSDINISALAYSTNADVLVIGYNNGNLDLLTRKGLVNMPDIKRKRITGIKTINQITTYNERAFLACEFGIVELDLNKQEVRDSYFFGDEGNSIKVNDVSILNGFIYAATESGIFKASLNAPNLVDYSFWERLVGVPENENEYSQIEAFNNELIAVFNSDSNMHDSIIRINADDSWQAWAPVSDTVFYSIKAHNNQLSVVTKNYSYFFNESLANINTFNIIYGRQAISDLDGTVYAAANYKGFLMYRATNDEVHLYINGPMFNTTGYIDTQGEYVWAGSGSRQNFYNDGAAHSFTNEQWRSLSSGYTEGLDGVGNFFKFAFHPTIDNYVYASSLGYGLYEFDNYEVKTIHNRETVPLFEQAILSKVGVRISDLAFDSDGDLWTVMEETVQPVFVLREGTGWEQLYLSSSVFSNGNEKWTGLVVTKTNQIWILNRSQGVIVLQEDSDGNIEEKHFNVRNQEGSLLSQAYCMVEDKNGNIWIGTNKGPIVYSTDNRLFDDPDFYGNQIKLARDDESGLADFLLDYEIINDIAVDGGNRKWIATENSGLFLVSEDGEETLHQFTEDTPQMISNSVISVGVHEKSGEVFISTTEGIIGFMGRATEGSEEFSDVYVYPNPVRPEYNGDITISGLIEDASIKVTDISGNMVYETTSLGGQAVWNGMNYDGVRVQTGVYLVFMTNSDGSKTQITKLVFIR